MIDHTGIGVADLARSAALLGALGWKRVFEMENDGGIAYGISG